jgi:hypothetical protein
MTTILAGQRAAFTKELAAYNRTEDESQKHLLAEKMVDRLKCSKQKGLLRT